MRSPDRYFSNHTIEGETCTLSGVEAHHLIHVMRGERGTKIVLFDGSGAEYLAQIERVGRTEVELAILSREGVTRELPIEATLGVSLPKGDRQQWLIEKAVELGVRRVVPVKTARSVAQPVEQALARLKRTVIEASKQCGRNRLMEIGVPLAWPEFVASAQGFSTRLLAHPSPSGSEGQAEPSLGTSTAAPLPGPILLAVGPEGGFTAEEVAMALGGGWHRVSLGPRTLRVETAAIALVAAVTCEAWGFSTTTQAR